MKKTTPEADSDYFCGLMKQNEGQKGQSVIVSSNIAR